ncbi:MAG: urease accessory protein UreD [Candidatus Competibacteraceae bacterium]|nr:urease accessory protein UreD [Candidatus Competibacteraceae bacterium]
MAINAALSSDTGWQAHLSLDFQHQHGRTILGRCRHHGPLRVQRPFYPEGDSVCHVAILHPPGGVVGGDELALDAVLSPDCRALITTPAAGKFYRSAGPIARQTQRLMVAAEAALEWLPQENIVFNGARVHARTRIELQGNAGFLGWEIVCLGRPAANEAFETGEYQQDFELWRDGEPIYLERGRYTGGSDALRAPWGLRGQPVVATLLCAGSPPEAVAAIRAAWAEGPARLPDEWSTVSQLDGALIGRYLGPSAVRARQFFLMAWNLLRPMVWQRPPCPSRFWTT